MNRKQLSVLLLFLLASPLNLLAQSYGTTTSPSKSRASNMVMYNGHTIFEEEASRNGVGVIGPAGSMTVPSNEGIQKYYCQVKRERRSPKYEAALKFYGVNILGYMTNNTYLIEADGTAYNKLAQIPYVELRPFEDKHKINNNLNTVSRDPSISSVGQLIEVIVVGDKSAAKDVFLQQLKDIGLVVKHTAERNWHYVVEAAATSSQIEDLKAMRQVLKVELNPAPRLLNGKSKEIMKVDWVSKQYGLKGKGQKIAICDSGIDDQHADFQGRILGIKEYTNDGSRDFSGHGTHVAGSALGSGKASDGKFSGTAPEAMLYFQEIQECPPLQAETTTRSSCMLSGIPYQLSDLFDDAYDKGVRIHSNSWGSDVCTCMEGNACKCLESVYNAKTSEIDEYVWMHPDMTILFAAGNIGHIFGDKSISLQASAKNCVSVGAAVRGTEKADFSSWGPVPVGRVKPDVVAPGVNITSTYASHELNRDFKEDRKHPKYATVSGTSMATPLVAGALGLIREHYSKQGLTYIPAALVRATLVNGAGEFVPEDPFNEEETEPTESMELVSNKANNSNGKMVLLGAPTESSEAEEVEKAKIYDINNNEAFDAYIPNIMEAVKEPSALGVHTNLLENNEYLVVDEPTNESGWGLVNMVNCIAPDKGELSYYVTEKGSGFKSMAEFEEFNFVVEDPSVPVSLTLVYHDPPDPLLEGYIVNQLLLQLETPRGNVIYPNGLKEEPMDILNNVQRIRLLNPTKGKYTVKVAANYIDATYGLQPYALVMTADDQLTKDVARKTAYSANFDLDVDRKNRAISFKPSFTPAYAIESWRWDFGDGVILSSDDMPNNGFTETIPATGNHTYKDFGEYKVSFFIKWINGQEREMNAEINFPMPKVAVSTTTECRTIHLDCELKPNYYDVESVSWRFDGEKKSSKPKFSYTSKKNRTYDVEAEVKLENGAVIKQKETVVVKCNKCKYKRMMRKKNKGK